MAVITAAQNLGKCCRSSWMLAGTSSLKLIRWWIADDPVFMPDYFVSKSGTLGHYPSHPPMESGKCEWDTVGLERHKTRCR